jgi:hypothetical protein
MTGLVNVFIATLPGSICIGSADAAGGGTKLAMRWNSEGGRPMWKSAPSGPAMCAATNSPRRWPVMRLISSPIRWP